MGFLRCKYRIDSKYCNINNKEIPITEIECKQHCQCCNTCLEQCNLFTHKSKISKLVEVFNIINFSKEPLSIKNKETDQPMSEEESIIQYIIDMDTISRDINDINSIIRDAYCLKLITLGHLSLFKNLKWYYCGLLEVIQETNLCELGYLTSGQLYKTYIKSKEFWSSDEIEKYKEVFNSYCNPDYQPFQDETEKFRQLKEKRAKDRRRNYR